MTEHLDTAPFVRSLLVATREADPASVRHQLDLAVVAFGLGGCLDDVLFPALREIGQGWRSGTVDIEDERLATEAARGWLEGLSLHAPRATDAAPLLLSCGPADRHSIGLEALGVLLQHQRRRCRVLGSRVSIRALATAVLADRPSAVVLVSHLSANRVSATQALRAVDAMGVGVFYAGDAFASAWSRRELPGTHLDGNLQSACSTIMAAPNGSIPG